MVDCFMVTMFLFWKIEVLDQNHILWCCVIGHYISEAYKYCAKLLINTEHKLLIICTEYKPKPFLICIRSRKEQIIIVTWVEKEKVALCLLFYMLILYSLILLHSMSGIATFPYLLTLFACKECLSFIGYSSWGMCLIFM